jgi:hypothetical protein
MIIWNTMKEVLYNVNFRDFYSPLHIFRVIKSTSNLKRASNHV